VFYVLPFKHNAFLTKQLVYIEPRENILYTEQEEDGTTTTHVAYGILYANVVIISVKEGILTIHLSNDILKRLTNYTSSVLHCHSDHVGFLRMR